MDLLLCVGQIASKFMIVIINCTTYTNDKLFILEYHNTIIN